MKVCAKIAFHWPIYSSCRLPVDHEFETIIFKMTVSTMRLRNISDDDLKNIEDNFKLLEQLLAEKAPHNPGVICMMVSWRHLDTGKIEDGILILTTKTE